MFGPWNEGVKNIINIRKVCITKLIELIPSFSFELSWEGIETYHMVPPN